MLTGDQNIIDIDSRCSGDRQRRRCILFNIRDPEATVKIAAESAMREIIGRTDIQPALTPRPGGTSRSRPGTLLQSILDEYEAGIEITGINCRKCSRRSR